MDASMMKMMMMMVTIISCLAFHNAKGAPRMAVYNFVKCNPEGDQSNCVTQQTPEIPWSDDLPARLPALAAQYLEAEPVEDESPVSWEQGAEEEEYEYEGTYGDELTALNENEEGVFEVEDDYYENEYDENEALNVIEKEDENEEGEVQLVSVESESSLTVLTLESSGDFEGSAGDAFLAGEGTLADISSGEYKVWSSEASKSLKSLLPGVLLTAAKPKAQEMKEDLLLSV